MAATGRAHSRHWSSRQANLAEVMEALARLDREARHRDDGDTEHPHPRNCVLNLISVIPQTHSFQRVEAAADRLADHHPLRVIALRLHAGERGRDRLAARVSSHTHRAGPGLAVQHDQVELEVAGGVSRQLRQLVEPLLVSDVTTVVWWEGAPPLEQRGFVDLVELGHLLVVDTGQLDDPGQTVSRLARLTRRTSLGIADLDWGRSRAWREVIAQVFSPPERRPFLTGLSGLDIEYAAGARASRVPASLLAGWLAYQARVPGGGLRIRETTGSGLPPGHIARLHLAASADQTPLQLTVERDRRHLHLELTIAGIAPVRQVAPLDSPSDGELLIWQMSHGRRDAVYTSALVAAARLLRN